jgi:type IV secretion system protein VirB5
MATAIKRAVGDPPDEARQLFRDRYRELEDAARNWRIVATGAVAVALVLAGGSIYLGVRSRYVPYVVTVDHQGFALSAPTAVGATEPLLGEDRILRYEIAGFVRDAREVIGDPLAETETLNRVKARANGAALEYLDHWYNGDGHAHDPFKLARDNRVSVDIDSILKLSGQTYQVRWTEHDWSLSGDPGPESNWEAVLTVALNPPAEFSQTLINPLGFTVSGISWTEQRQ